MRYSFDRFQLDPDLHRLEDADGREITLRPQAFKVLEYLVRRAPSVVSIFGGLVYEVRRLREDQILAALVYRVGPV